MREDLREQLEEHLAYAEGQNQIIRALDRELRPYWPRRDALKSALVHTHEWMNGGAAAAIDARLRPDKDIVVGYRRETAGQRKGLFAELLRLSEVFGPACQRRLIAKMEADAALRAADRIREILAKPPKPKRSAPTTGDLFTQN